MTFRCDTLETVHSASIVHKCFLFPPSTIRQVMCSCPDQKVGRQLILHRGLHPLVLDSSSSSSQQPRNAVDLAKSAGLCKAGDTVIVAYRDHDSQERDLALKIITVRAGKAVIRVMAE